MEETVESPARSATSAPDGGDSNTAFEQAPQGLDASAYVRATYIKRGERRRAMVGSWPRLVALAVPLD